MKEYLTKLKHKILSSVEQALLEIICLHEMGMTTGELAHFLPDPYGIHSEAHYSTRFAATKHLDLTEFSPTLD